MHDRQGAIAHRRGCCHRHLDPHRETIIEDPTTHDRAGYTPYAARTIRGWPDIVMRRGEIVVEHGILKAMPGIGTFVPRKGGAAAKPAGLISPEFDPQRNFGADLYWPGSRAR